MSEDLQQQGRRRVRLTTVVLTLLVLAIYGGFILMSVHRSHG
jgi:cytochrome c-type biogenesis protein CcmE